MPEVVQLELLRVEQISKDLMTPEYKQYFGKVLGNTRSETQSILAIARETMLRDIELGVVQPLNIPLSAKQKEVIHADI